MDIDEDDDFYSPDEPEAPVAQVTPAAAPPTASNPDAGDELEEGEEEYEGGEMDEDEDSVRLDAGTAHWHPADFLEPRISTSSSRPRTPPKLPRHREPRPQRPKVSSLLTASPDNPATAK
jgi:hypothetical protein